MLAAPAKSAQGGAAFNSALRVASAKATAYKHEQISALPSRLSARLYAYHVTWYAANGIRRRIFTCLLSSPASRSCMLCAYSTARRLTNIKTVHHTACANMPGMYERNESGGVMALVSMKWRRNVASMKISSAALVDGWRE